MSPQRTEVLEVFIDPIPSRKVWELFAAWIQEGKPHHVATVNAEFVMDARRDRAFRDVLRSVDLALADGIGIVWAAHYLARKTRRPFLTLAVSGISILFGSKKIRDVIPEQIAGNDLVAELAAHAAREGWSLFLLGAAPGVAEKAGAELTRRFPHLRLAGTFAGIPGTPAEDAEIIERVAAARPDILLVAFGHPKQERFIAQHKEALGIPVMIGVGGTLDYLARSRSLTGRRRARPEPHLVKRSGLRWLWRLLTQPERARRIWRAVPEFTAAVYREKHSKRHG